MGKLGNSSEYISQGKGVFIYHCVQWKVKSIFPEVFISWHCQACHMIGPGSVQ